MQIFNDKVLVQLHKAPPTITASGLTIPLFDNRESDGGKPISAVNSIEFIPKATVIKVSSQAKIELSPNDVVILNPQALSRQYQFFTDFSTLANDFTGVILIPSSLIDAKLEFITSN